MKRGRGGKEGVEHCWKRFAIIGNGLQLLETVCNYWESDTWLQCSVLRPREKPIGKTTHRWPGVPKARTRTQGETHIEGAALRTAPLCGFLDMGLSPGTGSCLWDARPAMCRFAYGFLHGSEHPALDHLSAFLWVSPWVRGFSLQFATGIRNDRN